MAVQHLLRDSFRAFHCQRFPVGAPAKIIYASLAFVVVFLFFSSRLFYVPYSTPHYGSPHAPGAPAAAGSGLSRPSQAVDFDLARSDVPFVSWPLARVCQEADWTPGVVYMCDNNSGGIGNIRNYILTCMRYAVDVGATGLILPRIVKRSEKDVADLFGESQPLDYFFDVPHFRAGLAEACPRMTIYDSIDDIPNLAVRKPETIEPKAYGDRSACDYRDLNRYTDLFRFRFHDWLADSARDLNLSSISLDHPRVFRFIWGVQWEYPVWKDGPEFANTYGGLLRFHSDILSVASEITRLMRKAADAFEKANKGGGGSSWLGWMPDRQAAGRYAGVHLRTEHDALSHWPDYDMQAAGFRERLEQHRAPMTGQDGGSVGGIETVYLATGNVTEAEKFIRHMEGFHVLTKNMLLRDEPEVLRQLEAFSWDQQALVDFVVLASSDYFLGVNPSSFSMTVAAKRHLQKDGIYSRPWRVGHDDGRSYLVGKYGNFWEDWLYMYDALWP